MAITIAEGAVNAAFQDADEGEMVRAWLQRKYRNIDLREHLQDEKNLSSAYRKLRYAGFGSSAAIQVLKEFVARADELSDEEPEEEQG